MGAAIPLSGACSGARAGPANDEDRARRTRVGGRAGRAEAWQRGGQNDMANGTRGRVVLVIGPKPGVGTSVIAANLAVDCAEQRWAETDDAQYEQLTNKVCPSCRRSPYSDGHFITRATHIGQAHGVWPILGISAHQKSAVI